MEKISVEVKQKTLFKKIFDIKTFIQNEKLYYGVYNAYFVLRENEIGKKTVVFDRNNIGRGILIDTTNKDVKLYLSLPATEEDINLFYSCVLKITESFHLTEFYYLNGKVSLNDIDKLKKETKEKSTSILEKMEKKFYLAGQDEIPLHCALHPIVFGEKEIDKVDGSLDKFADLLHTLQNRRGYYATPIIYQKKTGQMIVAFNIDEGMYTILPVIPHIYGPDKMELKEWYVFFAGGNAIPLTEFLNYLPQKYYYDSNHYAFNLNKEEMREMAINYNVNILTGEHEKGFYFGMIIDSGELYKSTKLLDTFSPYSHIAIFLKFAHTHFMLSDEFYEAIPEFTRILYSGDDLRKLIKLNRYINGEIRMDFFNEKGKKLVEPYYQMSEEGYLLDLKEYAESRKYKNFVDIPYDDQYFKEISEKIEKMIDKYSLDK